MIKIDNLSYSFPQKDLYNKISFKIEDQQHCAFIGTSGSGKSTLIDIIINQDKYMFDGNLDIAPNTTIGYVSQFYIKEKISESTVFEYIAEEFIKLQNEITSICNQMNTALDIDSLMEQYQQSLDKFNSIGGNDFENTINKQLNLTNLLKHKYLKVTQLSGGEFKLIQVIKEMLLRPDLIIMDEPDVFLDFENLNSLKNLINSHKGMMLVITHNRYLLNHCFDKILHLENMELQEFDGRYIDYNFSLLESKIELQELANIDDAEIARNTVLIDKLRELATNNSEAARGKSLKARLKIQERLEARKIKSPFLYIKQPNIRLVTENPIEEITALKVKDYSIAFSDILLENVNFEIKSNEKVAIIGANGTGKTTLIREIFKNSNNAIKINEGIEVAYLSQIQDEILNESNTILEEFFENGFKTYDEIKEYVLNYGFAEESINQKIGTLSGGEKNILQLAKIAHGKPNMLLLDEPSSHLDTYSQMALEKAIKNYNGSVVIISHDFYSIVNCTDFVLIIEDKTIRKMSMRKFRKMIYKKHFDKDYLEIEQKKTLVENKIELALKANDLELAKVLSKELESIIKLF